MAKSIEETIQALQEFRDNWTTLIGNEVVNFALDNFQLEAFQDGVSVTRWPKRKAGAPRDDGRKLLVDKGRLRRGVRVTTKTKDMVSIGTEAPYGQIHNEGGQVDVVQNVGEYSRTRRKKRETVRAHKRKMSFTIPQRKFVGKSEELDSRIIRRSEVDLFKIFN